MQVTRVDARRAKSVRERLDVIDVGTKGEGATPFRFIVNTRNQPQVVIRTLMVNIETCEKRATYQRDLASCVRRACLRPRC